MATALYRFPTIKETTDAAEAARPATVIAPADTLSQFSLAPLSAGDIIDRAVRLYRLHLLAFIRIVLPTSLLAFAGAILWTVGIRNISFEHGDLRMFTMVSAMVVGGLMWVVGKAGFLMVMGAASRALVLHFFNGTPLLARDVYRAVRERIWGLLGATIMLLIFTMVIVSALYTIFAMVIMVYFLAVMALTQILPNWMMMTMHVLFGGAVALCLIAAGLIAYARVVYTPQAMMVEGKGVFDAFGRSFTLAGREFKRIGAVLLFQFCVAWSLYALLLVPLGWYSYFHETEGLSVTSFFNTTGPLWFTIAQQTLTQLAEILIAPIVLLSFTLLYLDSRVRKEGFDVELLANRVLAPARYEQRTAVPPPAPVEPAPVHRRAIDWSEELAQELEAEATVPPPVVEPLPQVIEPLPQPEPLPFIEIPETATVQLTPVNEAAHEVAARFCASCGTEANERARFCATCGAKL